MKKMAEVGGLIRYTPVNKNSEPISEEWLILIDTVNKTFQWRDNISIHFSQVQKRIYEDQVEKEFPGYEWLCMYKACIDYKKGKPQYSSTNVWATNSSQALGIFKSMDIKPLNVVKQ